MINFYNHLTDKKVSQSLYEMLFSKFMQSDEPTYREYAGTLPVTITANGNDLIDWIIYGNTGGVGDRTENLFDYTTMQNGVIGAYLNSSGDEIENSLWAITDYIPCDGQAFTVGEVSGNSPSICLYDSNKTFIAGQAYNTGGITYFDDITITALQTAKYIRFSYYREHTANHVMLNQGSTALPYEPYGYKITILSNSDPTDIYIDAPLGVNETVSFEDTGVHIPTDNGQTVISCDNTVQPEKIYIKYIGG